jgi:hypothetical protein
MMFSPVGALCNENRQVVECAGIKVAGLAASERRNASLGLHQGTLQPSSSAAYASLAPYTGAGGARRRAISDRMSANICRGTATSASWKVT